MGLRFDMQWANWIAYLTVPGKVPPKSDSHGSDKMAIEGLINQLEHGFFSSPHYRREWLHMLHMVRGRVGPGWREDVFALIVSSTIWSKVSLRPI